jgi:hypothetical protein
MIGKRLFVMCAAALLLLLQFADCMSAMTPDHSSMQCCGSMPCTPQNQSQDCCKKMVSAPAPNAIPSDRVALYTPIAVNVEQVRELEIHRSAPVSRWTVEIQHSPPELYTLHASLLI